MTIYFIILTRVEGEVILNEIAKEAPATDEDALADNDIAIDILTAVNSPLIIFNFLI